MAISVPASLATPMFLIDFRLRSCFRGSTGGLTSRVLHGKPIGLQKTGG